MLYAGMVRAVAVGVLLAVITACGGGGSGGSGGQGTDVPSADNIDPGSLTSRPDVALPDIVAAHQKVLTRDNSRKALILALNAISFVESAAIPADPAVDFYADSFATSPALAKVSRMQRKIRRTSKMVSSKTVDVSDQLCSSGVAMSDGAITVDGVSVLHYRNCNTGYVTYDGDLELNVRSHVFDDTLTDATFTFRDMRITALDTDSVFDGVVVMTTAYPGAGFVTADLDVRDLILIKGIRVAGYRADFDIGYGTDGANYAYTVKQLRGRIYDDEGEYFDLGLTPTHEPWPILTGMNSHLTLSPSGMPAPWQVSVALDATGDNVAEYWLSAALDALASDNIANDHAPEFHFDTTPIRLDKGEKREVQFGNVSDADQQFVSLSWQLTQKPMGSNPVVDASANSFVFSSAVAGNYRVDVTASDGTRTTVQHIDIRVMYDMPELAVNGPATVNSGSGVSLSVSVLNPQEGAIRIAPLALPSLVYNDVSKTATFTPALPTFGVDQQVSVGFVVSNEDRQQVVTVPLTVRAQPNESSPVQLVGNQYEWNHSQDRIGQFTSSASKDVVIVRGALMDVFEMDGATLRYRESFDPGVPAGVYAINILAVHDVDGDGFDDILFGFKTADENYSVGIFDSRKHRSAAIRQIDGANPSDLVSKSIDVADLNADGKNEIVLFTTSMLYVFDRTLQLQWRSAEGSYGTNMVVANVDGDAALEMITSSGYIFDGVTHVMQQRGDPDAAPVDSLFAADLDGDGIREVYSAYEGHLRRMATTGYVDIAISYSIYSNVIVRNVDNDAADELLFLTFDGSGQGTSCWPFAVGGAISLGSVDLDGGNYNVQIIHSFEQGCSNNRQSLLAADDLDGDGSIEYLLSFPASAQVRIYRQQPNTSQQLQFAGPRLIGSFSGGASISSADDRIAFCGTVMPTPGGAASEDDIFTFDAAEGGLDTHFSWIPANENLQSYQMMPSCTSVKLDTQGHYGIFAVGPVWDAAAGKAQSLIDLVAVDGHSIAFKTFEGADLDRSGFADINGDGKTEVIMAGAIASAEYGRTQAISAFDLDSGEVRYLKPSFDGQGISHLAVGDVIPSNDRDEIVVLSSRFFQDGCLLQVIALDNTGGVQAKHEKSMAGSCSDFEKPIIADVNGDGKNEILIRRVEQDGAGSATQYVDVLDADLQTLTQWSAVGNLTEVALFAQGAGAALLASLEHEANSDRGRVVWRDGLDGHVIYQSPVLEHMGAELNFLVDSLTSKMHAVIAGGDRIYLTQ